MTALRTTVAASSGPRDGRATLDHLWSVHEIGQLVANYALAHDSHDRALLESVFAPADEPVAWPSFNIENLRRTLVLKWPHMGPTILFTGNHVIDLADDDTATGKLYCIARLALGGTWVEQAILYLDDYVRLEGTWRIAERRHLLWYGVELPERPFDQPKTQWPVSTVGRGSLPQDFPAWRATHGVDEVPEGFYAGPAPDEAWTEYTEPGAAH